MKKPKAQKLNDCYTALQHLKTNTKPQRKAKDGSIPVVAIVQVNNTKSEKQVQDECLAWLKEHRIMCDRCDAGTFQNQSGQWATYGIIGGGDIVGLTKTGRHFELEIKRGKGGRLSRQQQKRMEDINNNNGIYLVICGVEELEFYNKHYGYFE